MTHRHPPKQSRRRRGGNHDGRQPSPFLPTQSQHQRSVVSLPKPTPASLRLHRRRSSQPLSPLNPSNLQPRAGHHPSANHGHHGPYSQFPDHMARYLHVGYVYPHQRIIGHSSYQLLQPDFYDPPPLSCREFPTQGIEDEAEAVVVCQAVLVHPMNLSMETTKPSYEEVDDIYYDIVPPMGKQDVNWIRHYASDMEARRSLLLKGECDGSFPTLCS